MLQINFLCTVLTILIVAGELLAQEPQNAEPELLEVRKIWDKAPHNAFTDLLRHKGRWYCAFREGSRHVSPDGSLRIITSKDGETWTSLSLVSHPTDDLRDAKLSVTPDGQLMLNGAGMQADKPVRYHSMSWFSADNGKTWDDGRRIGDPGFWLWRAQWRNGFVYSMGYATDRDRSQRVLRLYHSKDGKTFDPLVSKLDVPNGVGEDRILFLKDGASFACCAEKPAQRRDCLASHLRHTPNGPGKKAICESAGQT